MSRVGLIDLPPLNADQTVAEACAREATPLRQQALKIVTLMADEKVLLAAAAAIWAVTRCKSSETFKREADRMLLSTVAAGAVPHLFKFLVNRKRPDRTVKGPRHGIPRSGDAWDSFPSGHAVHLGAMGGSLMRLSPGWLQPFVWPALGAVALTRVMLLAHYPSDVVAGWGIGLLIDRAVIALLKRRSEASPSGGYGRPHRNPGVFKALLSKSNFRRD
jgi:undecaprenyl-diphosphatase